MPPPPPHPSSPLNETLDEIRRMQGAEEKESCHHFKQHNIFVGSYWFVIRLTLRKNVER